MIPVQVTVQFMRANIKESTRIKLAMEATVNETIAKLLQELGLPAEERGQPVRYQLIRQRQVLDQDAKLYEAGIQENDILQLMAYDANSTLGVKAISGGVLSRLGGKVSGEPLPVPAALVDKTGKHTFQLTTTRAMIGRADPKLGYPAEMFDAELTALDPKRTVSRPHALIVYVNGDFTIRDLYSQHGLYLNGNRLSPNKSHTLADGDTVTFGTVELQFRCIT